ncbi:MAG TPA: hypothetical protein VFQ54_08855 [Thermomicrobiales bacterium]|nr:hypothetical protein [Thermomicrobiales bacterium]
MREALQPVQICRDIRDLILKAILQLANLTFQIDDPGDQRIHRLLNGAVDASVDPRYQIAQVRFVVEMLHARLLA